MGLESLITVGERLAGRLLYGEILAEFPTPRVRVTAEVA